MIKSDFGKVEIHGNITLLQTELCSLIRCFLKEGVVQNKEELDDIIEKAMMSDEEIKQDLANKNLSSKDMLKLLNELVEARKSGLVRKEKEDEEIKVTKILDNDNFKITKVELNGDGKTKEEIGDILKKLFEEGEIT